MMRPEPDFCPPQGGNQTILALTPEGVSISCRPALDRTAHS